jgi:hypothetical protein
MMSFTLTFDAFAAMLQPGPKYRQSFYRGFPSIGAANSRTTSPAVTPYNVPVFAPTRSPHT